MLTRNLKGNFKGIYISQRVYYPHDIECKDTIKHFTLKMDSDKKEGHTKEKTIHNLRWVNATIESSRRTCNSKALYIDGKKGRTTRVLQSAGYTGSDCYVINKECNLAEEHYLPVNYVGKTFQEYLSDYDPAQGKFASVWYDGCQTFAGNKSVPGPKPVDDLKLILETCVGYNSILAITFCTRHLKKKLPRTIAQINRMIRTAGFEFETFSYKEKTYNTFNKCMCFYMVRLLDPNNTKKVL